MYILFGFYSFDFKLIEWVWYPPIFMSPSQHSSSGAIHSSELE